MAAKRPTRKTAKKTAAASAGARKRSASKATPKAKKATAKAARAKKRPAAKARRGSGGGASDRVQLVQEIIDVMEVRGAVEVELRDGDFRLRIRRREEHPPTAWAQPPVQMAPGPQVHGGGGPQQGPAEQPADNPDGLPPGTEVFASPMVGTFYRASQPDSEPFVKDGDRVDAESVLCIIEAMKVMNEIKAESAFEIVRVLAENGEPVEYGQPLFVVKA